jgi:hypothetical protein
MIKSSCSDISNRPEIQSKEMLVNILTMPGRILGKCAHLRRYTVSAEMNICKLISVLCLFHVKHIYMDSNLSKISVNTETLNGLKIR